MRLDRRLVPLLCLDSLIGLSARRGDEAELGSQGLDEDRTQNAVRTIRDGTATASEAPGAVRK